MNVIQLLFEEINIYYNQYSDTVHDGSEYLQLSDMTVQEITDLRLSYKWDTMNGTHLNVTGPLSSSSICHFTVTQNVIYFFMY